MNKAEREALIARHPRVKRLAAGVQCTAITFKAKRQCRNTALWRFRALPTSWARDGHYCTEHLGQRGIYNDWREAAATERWLNRVLGRTNDGR